MLSGFYKAFLTNRNEITIQGIPRASNLPPRTKIGGETYDGTTSTDVSIIKTSGNITMGPAIALLTKQAMI